MTGEVAALLAALSFGASLVLARRFMVAVAPESGVLVSIAANVTIFSMLALAAAWRGLLPPIDTRSIGLFAFGGIFGTLVGRNLTYQSIGRLGAALATSIRLSNSVFTLLLGYLVLQELPRPWQLVGLVLVTLGLWVSLQGGRHSGDRPTRPRSLSGVLLAIGGAAAFAVGDTARRTGLKLTPAPILAAAVGAAVALIAHLTWSAFYRSAGWPTGSALRRFDVLASALFNTLGLLMLYVGLSRAPVAIVSVLYNLQTLVVLILSPMALRGQETLTTWLVIGTLTALIGTAIILLG